MDFDDLIAEREPPPKRVGKSFGPLEHHFYEGAVMVAYAMHLLRTTAAKEVRIHPDGEHGKQFDFTGWLTRRGFNKVSATGTTSYGGQYLNPSTGHVIVVNPKSGLGDVVAQADDVLIVAECKGGGDQHTPSRAGIEAREGPTRNRRAIALQAPSRPPGCRRAPYGSNARNSPATCAALC